MLKQENGDRPIRLLGYDFMRKMHTRRICPNVDGIRNSIRVLTLTKDHLGDVGFRLSSKAPDGVSAQFDSGRDASLTGIGLLGYSSDYMSRW